MLEGLDGIDWKSLTHAYGSAADVPGLLRGLASADDEKREEALYELFGNVWHQGTVYSATAAAVPFLYELLNSPDTQDKANIAGLLGSIAAGRGYLEVHAADDSGKKSWEKMLKEKGKTLEGELKREAAETAAVRRAVAARLPDLIPYLGDPESEENRRAVAEGLGYFPEHSAVIVPALRAALESESDEDVVAAIEESLQRLDESAED